MDPERRATYDALAGFSASSINPFADTSLPADQVFVDEYTCIGCRNCTNVCPKCVVDFCQQHAGSAAVTACAAVQQSGVLPQARHSAAQHSTAQRLPLQPIRWTSCQHHTLTHTLLQRLHHLSPDVSGCALVSDCAGRLQ